MKESNPWAAGLLEETQLPAPAARGDLCLPRRRTGTGLEALMSAPDPGAAAGRGWPLAGGDQGLHRASSVWQASPCQQQPLGLAGYLSRVLPAPGSSSQAGRCRSGLCPLCLQANRTYSFPSRVLKSGPLPLFSRYYCGSPQLRLSQLIANSLQD